MPNVIELLNQDHREVEQLFSQFESTQDFDIALQICQELTVHATVEEEIVYPVLERIDPEIEHEAEKEHAEAKELIARIQSMSPGDPDLVSTVMKLKAGIVHHVEEEEGEAWPKMRSDAGDRLTSLGQQVEERKLEIVSTLVSATAGVTAPATAVRGTGSADFDSMTKDDLYRLAKERNIEGRSNMKKADLIRALSRS
jgi:hemerythrin superfamily protein